MQFKKLALAAAIVCSSPAFAGIEAGQAVGDAAEVWALVWDEAKGTYAIDFGVTVGQLLAATDPFVLGSVGAPGDTSWASFVSADGNLNDFSQFEGTRWAVFAVADYDGFPGQPEGRVYYTTTTSSVPIVQTDANLESTFDAMGYLGFAGTLNANGLGQVASQNGSTFNAVGSPANFLEFGYGGGFGLYAGNAIGSGAQTLFRCTNGAFFDGTAQSVCRQAGQELMVAFNGTTFAASVTAVPEPGSYALMAAGLLAMGFVIRRRA